MARLPSSVLRPREECYSTVTIQVNGSSGPTRLDSKRTLFVSVLEVLPGVAPAWTNYVSRSYAILRQHYEAIVPSAGRPEMASQLSERRAKPSAATPRKKGRRHTIDIPRLSPLTSHLPHPRATHAGYEKDSRCFSRIPTSPFVSSVFLDQGDFHIR
jgi:hypothetical protein